MSEILIIGGTRFVGPPLISKLLSNENNITIFCRGTDYGYTLDAKIRIIKGDREKEADLRKIFFQKYDLVFDMCCYSKQHADDLLAALRGNFNHLAWSALQPGDDVLVNVSVSMDTTGKEIVSVGQILVNNK